MSSTPEVVAVLGSAGFVSRAVAAELRARGRQVRPVLAPRLRSPIGQLYEVAALPVSAYLQVVEQLASTLAGAQLVVNAAGVPDGTAPASPELYGANALLPSLVARACRLAGVQRYLHLSSAAVQGRSGPLDESARTAPFSPYTHSKALGESLLLSEPPAGQVLFRATWVHDAGRPHTHALIRLARSRASCVAGAGTDPTPQVLIGDLTSSIAQVLLATGSVPPIVLQPHSGMTTGLLLRLLGGREPRHLPRWLASTGVAALRGYARTGRRANAHARRVEMLLFGRPQEPGWLTEQGMVPVLKPDAWQRLASAPPPPAGTVV